MATLETACFILLYLQYDTFLSLIRVYRDFTSNCNTISLTAWTNRGLSWYQARTLLYSLSLPVSLLPSCLLPSSYPRAIDTFAPIACSMISQTCLTGHGHSQALICFGQLLITYLVLVHGDGARTFPQQLSTTSISSSSPHRETTSLLQVTFNRDMANQSRFGAPFESALPSY